MAHRDPSAVPPIAPPQALPVTEDVATASSEKARINLPLPTGPYPFLVNLGAVRELAEFVGEPGGTPYGLLIGSTGPDGLSMEDTVRRRLPPDVRLDSPGNIQAAVFQLMDGIIARVTGPESQPVGVFRGQTGGRPVLTEQDCQLVQRCATWLPRTGALFLVIRSLGQKPRSAAVFLIGDRPTASSTPLMEFPLDEHLLRNGYRGSVPAAGEEAMVAPAGPGRQAGGFRWTLPIFLVAAAAGVGLSALGGWGIHYWTSQRAAKSAAPATASIPEEGFGFRASRSGKDVELTWNRAAPPVLGSIGGMLTIHDGPGLRAVMLTAVQLREGRVIYQAHSGADLDFRLEVTSPNGNTRAESIQIIGAATSDSAVASAKPAAPARRVEQSPPQTAAATPPVASPRSQNSAPLQGAVKPFQAPVGDDSRAAPADPAALSPAPPAGGTQGRAAEAPSVLQQAAVPTPAPIGPPAATQPAPQTQQPSPQPSVVQQPLNTSPATPQGQAPSSSAPSSPVRVPERQFVGPQPTRKVNPTMTTDAAEELRVAHGAVSVVVQVKIDANGMVRSADAVSTSGNVRGGGMYLKLAAVSAARKWRFQPATIDGKAVPSEMQVTFAFRN